MEKETEIKRLSTLVRQMVAKVPVSVTGGFHGDAVAFKKAAQDAQREIAKSRPSIGKLKQAHDALARFY